MVQYSKLCLYQKSLVWCALVSYTNQQVSDLKTCCAVVWQKLQVPSAFCSEACCLVSRTSNGLFAGYKGHELLGFLRSHLAGYSNKPPAAFWLDIKSGIWIFCIMYQRKWSVFEEPLLVHSTEQAEVLHHVQHATWLSLPQQAPPQ